MTLVEMNTAAEKLGRAFGFVIEGTRFYFLFWSIGRLGVRYIPMEGYRTTSFAGLRPSFLLVTCVVYLLLFKTYRRLLLLLK